MKKWLQKIISTLSKWSQPAYITVYNEELPDALADQTIYLIGQPNAPWLITFKCPCGCNKIIHLNLLKEADPCWSYRITSKKKIHISPSVWRTNGCKSHFFIRGSKIDWVANYKRRKKFDNANNY
jgi:hypothetical protein